LMASATMAAMRPTLGTGPTEDESRTATVETLWSATVKLVTTVGPGVPPWGAPVGAARGEGGEGDAWRADAACTCTSAAAAHARARGGGHNPRWKDRGGEGERTSQVGQEPEGHVHHNDPRRHDAPPGAYTSNAACSSAVMTARPLPVMPDPLRDAVGSPTTLTAQPTKSPGYLEGRPGASSDQPAVVLSPSPISEGGRMRPRGWTGRGSR
jgi:hypothetical protein